MGSGSGFSHRVFPSQTPSPVGSVLVASFLPSPPLPCLVWPAGRWFWGRNRLRRWSWLTEQLVVSDTGTEPVHPRCPRHPGSVPASPAPWAAVPTARPAFSAEERALCPRAPKPPPRRGQGRPNSLFVPAPQVAAPERSGRAVRFPTLRRTMEYVVRTSVEGWLASVVDPASLFSAPASPGHTG